MSTGGQMVSATLGGLVRLDAGSSTDPDGDTITYQWSVEARPAGSIAALSASTGAVIDFRPDAMGDYTIQVRATDSKGGASTASVTVRVDNRSPNSALLITPSFTPSTTNAPPQSITLGASIVLDGSVARDPDGDAVSIQWALTQRPAGSAASLVDVAAQSRRLVPDVLGTYRVQVTMQDARGASSITVYTFEVNNRPPAAVVGATISPVVADGGRSSIVTSTGYDVLLNSANSTDPDSAQTLTRSWTLTSRPAGSTAALSASSGQAVSFSPDVLGTYVVTLTVTDPLGASSTHVVTVTANNRRPVAALTSNATPQALAAAPGVRLPLGTELTLRATTSRDADGDALTYAWTVDIRPANSSATLSSSTDPVVRFTADREGTYVFRLRATDPQNAFSETTLTLTVGGGAPVAVIDRANISELVGTAVSASAALSFDPEGAALTYAWTLDARPSGSSAAIGAVQTAQVSFTPDLPGTYVLAVTVSDGQYSAVGYLTVRALAQIASSVSLNFKPEHAQYNRASDRFLATSTNPSTLRVVDAFTGNQRAVLLPDSARRLGVSPNGRYAAVLHNGVVSFIDVDRAVLLRSFSTSGEQTEVFVTNDAKVIVMGQAGGQWVDSPWNVFDGLTGVRVPTTSTGYGNGRFYGTQYGVYADRFSRTITMSMGISPSDLDLLEFNPTTFNPVRATDSPYHGDYSMDVPIGLTDSQDLVMTSVGTYFRTSDLRYAGRLSNVFALRSFSHNGAQEEALVVAITGSSLGAEYLRFTGPLMLPGGSLPMPLIGGNQSYALSAWLSAAGRHVLLGQVGSDQESAAGVTYHLVVR
jgi:hypothetical protein